MIDFSFRMLTKVVYGRGMAKKIGEECKKLGAKKVFYVTDEFMVQNSPAFPVILESMKQAGLEVMVYSDIQPDPSIEVVMKASQAMKDFGADVAVALGGGSPMDCAKSVCMLQTNEGSIADYMYKRRTITNPAKPLICIPTTAGTGSEVTAGAVTTDKQSQEKIGVSDDTMMAKLAVIDPELLLSMPPSLTASTGLDALCHAIEGYTSTQSHPISDAMCLHSIRLVGENLVKSVANGRDIDARGNMALASLMAAAAFTNVGLGAVHAIAHCLGAMYHVPHGVANAVMLPHVMEFNVPATPEKFRQIAIALGQNVDGLNLRDAAYKSVEAVRQFNIDCGIPTLKAVGLTAEDIPTVVKNSITYRLMPCNPRTVSEKDLERILNSALALG